MKKYKIKWAGRTHCCCCCHRCSPASVRTCPPSFTSASSRLPTPVYLLPFTCSRLPTFIHPFSFTVRPLSSTTLILVQPPSLICSPLSTPTGCLTRHLPTASSRPPHFPLALHACAPAICSCTGSFIHVRLCHSGVCFGRGQGFDQSPETEHLMLGFVCTV